MKKKNKKREVNTRDYVTQQRYTEKKSIMITTMALDKIYNESKKAQKKPMLILQIKQNNALWKLYIDIIKEETL